MEVRIFLWGLMKSPEVQSFLICCGASATWEALKAAFINKKRINSSEAQAFCVVKETFKIFYQKKQLEFDEEIVMNAFLEATKSSLDLKEKLITKKILSETLGYKVKERDVKEWTATFAKTLIQDNRIEEAMERLRESREIELENSNEERVKEIEKIVAELQTK